MCVDFTHKKQFGKQLSPAEAEQKIKNWCAYQERSQNETRYQLLSYGLTIEEADLLISKLIVENFLNEERFAVALAGGKLRIKHWGKTKIKYELKKHKVSDYCLKFALKNIDDDEYEKILTLLLEKKISTSKTSDKKKLFNTVLKYALSKGFELELVSQKLNILIENINES